MLFGRPSSGAGGIGSQSPGGEPRTVGVLRSKLSGSRSSPAAARMRWASLGAATAVAVGLGVGKLISKLFRCRGAPDAADMPPAVADVERGASDLAVQVAESAPVRAEGATEAAESPLPQSVGVTVAISSRDAVPEHAPLSEMGAVVSEDQEQAGAPVGSASRHSYNHRRNMRSDSEGHLSPTRAADSYPEGVQPGRGYTRATLSTIGWGRLARQHQGPPFRRGWRHQQEQDELNRLLDLALDSPLQLLVEFQRQSPIVERLMRLQNAPETHLEHLPWQLIVAHQQLELAIDHMSYEDLWEHFGGASPPQTACQASVEKLPSHTVTEKHACIGVGAGGHHSCPICLQLFTIGEEFRSLECSHSFHKECVDTWLTQHRGDCPVCRTSVIKA